MKKLLTALLTIGILFTFPSTAQSRESRPMEVQINLSGVFLGAFGESISDEEITHFSVGNWFLPGISIGKHWGKHLYSGFSYTPSRHIHMQEPWGFNTGVRDAEIDLQYQTGHVLNLENRIYPFSFGLYVSGSLTYLSKGEYEMYFERIGDTFQIGNSQYATDLFIDWHFKSVITFSPGLGFNHVFGNGFSYNLGMQVPIVQGPYYQEINIEPTDSEVNITDADLELIRVSIRNETFYYPVQFVINVGYNF